MILATLGYDHVCCSLGKYRGGQKISHAGRTKGCDRKFGLSILKLNLRWAAKSAAIKVEYGSVGSRIPLGIEGGNYRLAAVLAAGGQPLRQLYLYEGGEAGAAGVFQNQSIGNWAFIGACLRAVAYYLTIYGHSHRTAAVHIDRVGHALLEQIIGQCWQLPALTVAVAAAGKSGQH